MKKYLTALFTALALAGASSAPAVPRAGGELSFAIDATSAPQFVLDPHNSGFAPYNRIFRSIFDSLVVLNADQSVGPWLAESWTISPDRLQYTFTLRQGVTFHDGTPFDARAVKVNLDRIHLRENALTALPDIGPYVSSEVLDGRTVRITLSEPFEPLLRNLSKTTLGIISPAALEKHGSAIGRNPVGTGPFKLASLVQGAEVRLERNPDYRWAPAGAANPGPAHLDRLVFKNVPEEATRIAVLQSGQVLAADGIPPHAVVSLKANPAFKLIERELLNNNYTLYLNVAKEPWNDPAVRRAFFQSVDVDALVKVVYLGTAPRAWSPLSPSLFGYDASLEKSWKYDPAQAARALDEAGWTKGADGVRSKNGKRLTVAFVDTQGNREKRIDILQLVRRQVAQNGFELTISTQANGIYRQRLTDGDYDLAAASQFAPDPDVLRRLHLPDGRTPSSVSKVDDPDISRWLVDGYREGDPAKRAELYRQIQRKLVEQSYALPIYVLLYGVAVGKNVEGVEIDVHGFPVFQNAWLSDAN